MTCQPCQLSRRQLIKVHLPSGNAWFRLTLWLQLADRSSMAPTLLMKNGKPVAAFDSPGGATIINSVLNVTLNLIDHGMTPQQAIDAPRLSVTHATGPVSCEGGARFSVATQNALRNQGHIGLGEAGTDGCRQTIGSVQAVIMDLATEMQNGAADPRREGTVIRVKPAAALPNGQR